MFLNWLSSVAIRLRHRVVTINDIHSLSTKRRIAGVNQEKARKNNMESHTKGVRITFHQPHPTPSSPPLKAYSVSRKDAVNRLATIVARIK